MYPKTFFASRADEIEPATCFVIMPFAKAFTPTFKAIQNAVGGDLGFRCMRTDELLGGGHIIEDILKGIASSELVIADVTGRNANVYYELGIAHMAKPVEKVILLSQDVDEIPFDLRQFRHIVYKAGGAGLKALTKSLRETVSATSKRVPRIFVDERGRGSLSGRDMLMGADHCLYEFQVKGGIAGQEAAKFDLKVIRHFMDDGHKQEVAFFGPMGLRLNERRPIESLRDWDIALEHAPDGKTCFRIYENDARPRPRSTGKKLK